MSIPEILPVCNAGLLKIRTQIAEEILSPFETGFSKEMEAVKVALAALRRSIDEASTLPSLSPSSPPSSLVAPPAVVGPKTGVLSDDLPKSSIVDEICRSFDKKPKTILRHKEETKAEPCLLIPVKNSYAHHWAHKTFLWTDAPRGNDAYRVLGIRCRATGTGHFVCKELCVHGSPNLLKTEFSFHSSLVEVKDLTANPVLLQPNCAGVRVVYDTGEDATLDEVEIEVIVKHCEEEMRELRKKA